MERAGLGPATVLNCARRAIPPGLRIEHGTTFGRRDHLLRSTQSDRGLGKLKPDVLVMRGDSAVAVIDAKYKRLAFSRERRNEVDQADLYQLVAYATRYQPEVSALVYPCGDSAEPPAAEALGPWRGGDLTFLFRRLATDAGVSARSSPH